LASVVKRTRGSVDRGHGERGAEGQQLRVDVGSLRNEHHEAEFVVREGLKN
jgi:hypothetical protein